MATPARSPAFRARALLCLPLLCAACGREEPVRIGVVMGAAGIAGARLAAADVNAAGGIDGRPLELVVLEGSGVEARPAIAAAERLAADSRVLAVVGHSNSAASLAASQVYNARGLVHISPNSTAPLLREAGPYTFRLVPDDTRQATFLAEQGHTLASSGTAAIVYDNDDYGRALSLELARALDSAGVRVVSTTPYLGSGEGNTLANLPAILTRDTPGVVYWLGRAPLLPPVLAALRAALPGVPVLGSDGIEGPEVYASPASFAGLRFVRFVDAEGGNACIARLSARLRAEMGGRPTTEGVLGYDAVMLLAHAAAGGARDREAVRRHLETVGRGTPAFAGCAGPVAFDAAGDAERPYHLARVDAHGVRTVAAGVARRR